MLDYRVILLTIIPQILQNVGFSCNFAYYHSGSPTRGNELKRDQCSLGRNRTVRENQGCTGLSRKVDRRTAFNISGSMQEAVTCKQLETNAQLDFTQQLWDAQQVNY